MSSAERIAAAANAEVPAFLTLREEGFSVHIFSRDPEVWEAKKGSITLVGGSPLELLAVWTLRSRRGKAWMASDAEIEDFLQRFYPERAR